MTTRLPINRRRFIAISAAAAGLPLLPTAARAAPPPLLRVWTGDALGANATLQIHHPDPTTADMLIARALAEVRRLERVLSLYCEHSALCRLNRVGSLDDPPLDLVRVLAEAEQYHALTSGAFDITVQPLWDLYAAHFGRSDADPAGPSSSAITAALGRVGQAALEFAPDRIAFARPGMAITLNGIGQGYITDRIVDLLHAGGVEHALVDMGETRALGAHPSGEPWRVGIESPGMPRQIAERVLLKDRAIATSGGYGTQFELRRVLQPYLRPDEWSHFLAVSGRFDDRIDGNRGRRAFHRVLPHAARTDPRSGTSPQVKRAPGNAGWTARIDGGLTK